jgi:N-methylhydantoinase B
MRNEEGPPTHFNFGPEREEYERYWTPEAYDAMTKIMASLPNHWRFFVKARIFDAMNASETGGVEVVRSAFANIAAEHPQIGAMVD